MKSKEELFSLTDLFLTELELQIKFFKLTSLALEKQNLLLLRQGERGRSLALYINFCGNLKLKEIIQGIIKLLILEKIKRLK
jgi:hypothetical protein